MLELPVRRRIYQFIRANPGIHFRFIQRELDLSIGQLDFHLNEMIKKDLLVKQSSQGKTQFFIRDSFKKEERKTMSYLRKDVTRSIILYIKENPGSTPKDLLSNFNFTGPNLSYHLSRMVKDGIIRFNQEGRERRYFVINDEMLSDLLITYRTTLFDKVIDIIGP